jgi:murein DD-endopeptidase MepM/ murein hydrolase activator NlpD
MDHDPILREFIQFLGAFGSYIFNRLHNLGLNFERVKDFVVDVLMVKRGANTSAFVHLSILGLAIAVLLGGGVFSSSSVVSGSYPGVQANPLVAGASVENSGGSGVITSSITPVTIISEKPRDKVIEYEVAEGDTISSIAEEYGVSENTILWENDLTANSQIKEGQKLKILPVSGIAHEVESGDTIYSVAKKYQANAQAIIDFPFNDVGDDFALSTGDTLIVPDGAPPEKPKQAPTQYLAQQNIPVGDLGSGQFLWPASGDLSQYFSWYHPAIDVSNLGGGPIRAADSGTVTVAGWPDNYGYGNRVQIDHGNGYATLYAHLSAIYVSPGQTVAKGDVIGAMGSTGRSTGTHLHLEIRRDGVAQNPLSFLGR